jgi:heptosyltransferase-2
LIYIGFNFFSGERWPSKEIYQDQQILLINLIDNYFNSKNVPHRLVIFSDHTSNTKAGFIKKYCPFVFIYDTSKSVFDFNAALLLCDYVISSDSLGLHLAIANQIPNLSFYGPTSAVEIDTFNKGVKVISTSDDYCSYKSITDNSSLTANRLFSAWKKHFEQINFSVS